jgi:DNA polymerase V
LTDITLDFVAYGQEIKETVTSCTGSRSFGQRVESLQELREAISYHASNAAKRLRKQRLFASSVSVFIQNSPFDQAEFYGKTKTVALPAPPNAACKSRMPRCGC